MDTAILLTIITALGTGAFKYLLDEQKGLKDRITNLERRLGIKDRAYNRVRSLYLREVEAHAATRQRFQVIEGLKHLDQRYPPKPPSGESSGGTPA